ncbi:MFS general substrate transporter [Mycena venus]|uniref:MFS general substrate transporter n=1 Tax=Mycena venus TaxID=2733690 RepID=A0A8H6YHJ6_9AGAR|nr:MFS general substrate transporter [Mycena venus]
MPARPSLSTPCLPPSILSPFLPHTNPPAASSSPFSSSSSTNGAAKTLSATTPPQIFANIGFTGTKNSLLASRIYGVVKVCGWFAEGGSERVERGVVATSIFVLAFVDSLRGKLSLFISAIGMGVFFFFISALLNESLPPATSTHAFGPSLYFKAIKNVLNALQVISDDCLVCLCPPTF